MKQQTISEVDFLIMRTMYWFLQEYEFKSPKQRTDRIIKNLYDILQNNQQYGSINLEDHGSCRRLVKLMRSSLGASSQQTLI